MARRNNDESNGEREENEGKRNVTRRIPPAGTSGIGSKIGGYVSAHQEELNRREFRARAELLTLAYAKSKGIWVENFWDRFGEPDLNETTESVVYFNEPEQNILKINNLIYYDYNPAYFLGTLPIWNSLFPANSYEIRGFTRFKTGDMAASTNSLGVILTQPLVAIERSATMEEKIDALIQMEFEVDPMTFNVFRGVYHPGLDIWLMDIHSGNVVIDTEGVIQFVDAGLRLGESHIVTTDTSEQLEMLAERVNTGRYNPIEELNRA
jgi:hypothetical protein